MIKDLDWMFGWRRVVANALFLVLGVMPVLAQDSAAVNVRDVLGYTHIRNIDRLDTSFKAPDTTLTHFHHYLPDFSKNYLNLGSIGLEGQSLIMTPEHNREFDAGMNFLEKYTFDSENIPYYLAKRPYTNLFFVTGSRQQQFFDALHTQNLTPRLNVGFRFRKLSSGGYYLDQDVNHTNLLFQVAYQSANNRYRLFANTSFSNLNAAENGGLSNDTSLINIYEYGAEGVNVQLEDAHNEKKNTTYYVKQYINLGKKIKVSHDTDSVEVYKVQPASRIAHEVQYQRTGYLYRDAAPDSGFYANLLALPENTTNLEDTLFNGTLQNTVSWTYLKGRHLNPSVALKHEYADVYQNQQRYFIHNYILEASVFSRGDSLLNGSLAGGYVLSGYNQGGFYISGDIHKSLDTTVTINVRGSFDHFRPDLIQSTYYHDNFSWNNAFNYSNTIKASANVAVAEWGSSFTFRYLGLQNHVYYDTVAAPQQYNGGINLVQAQIGQEFDLGKRFHTQHRLLFQEELGNSDIIRFPTIFTYHKVYYENYFFKKAMLAQIGFDVSFFSTYYANAYHPLTKQFYLQHTKKVGGYPYFDFFIAARIKKARVFLKLNHINHGVSGDNYFLYYHYPNSGLTFNIGLDWTFIN